MNITKGDLIVTKGDHIYELLEDFSSGRGLHYTKCKRIFPYPSSCIFIYIEGVMVGEPIAGSSLKRWIATEGREDACY